jgi:2-polyprenyl-3-methyl-5-hydroxy-6-metoxy-1,4-benzoquinol methylase
MKSDKGMASSFDEHWYLLRYPDVAQAILHGKVPSALAHYERHGREEGRQPASPAGVDSGPVRPKSYQTFPGEEGDSDSQRKLLALKLPSFQGKSVLDVGCNEGFFSFEAARGGAARVLGIDRNPEFISRAKARHATLRMEGNLAFDCLTWDALPDEKFDVILLLSALHYADDQSAMIQRLIGRLTPRGVLVLEAGVVDEERSAILKVSRAIDVVSFPTFGKMKEWLAPYAWKLMGASVEQKGDPIPRKVFHIQPFRNEVILLLGSGHTGKTTFARTLAKPGIPNIMIDDHILLYHQKRLDDSKLSKIVRTFYDGQRMDLLYRQLVIDDAIDDLTDDIARALDVINAPVVVVEGALGDNPATRDRVAKRLESRGYYVWLCSRP